MYGKCTYITRDYERLYIIHHWYYIGTNIKVELHHGAKHMAEITRLAACRAIVSTLRVLNQWNDPVINQIYDLAYNHMRENTLRRVK